MPHQKPADLTGKRFGRFVAIKIHHTKQKFRKGIKTGNDYYWLCKCDCGKEKVTLNARLLAGRTKSCGCKTMLDREPGQSGLNLLFKQYKHHATKKERDFLLTIEQFKELTGKKCHYCGELPSYTMGRMMSKYAQYTYNGIDRIDSSKGYSLDNVLPCCGTCNTMKMGLSYDDFISKVKKISNHIENKS
jgi:hypothetical protein